MISTLTLEELNNVSEIDVIYTRQVKVKMKERPLIKSSADSAAVLRHYWDPNKIGLLEQFRFLLLNRANRVLYIDLLSTGGITCTICDPRIVMATALKKAACGIIIAHNHPSGSAAPSQSDEELTQKLQMAARLFDIRVLDHIILTADEYYSFADNGLL